MQRSVSLLILQGNSPVLLTGMVHELLHFAYIFFYSMSLLKITTTVLEGYLYARGPLGSL